MRAEIKPTSGQADMGLVPVTSGSIGGVECLVVNARDLHAAIRSKRQFADWAKYKISKFGFDEGVDFEILRSCGTVSVSAFCGFGFLMRPLRQVGRDANNGR